MSILSKIPNLTAAISMLTAVSFVAVPVSAYAAPVMPLFTAYSSSTDHVSENNASVELVKHWKKRRFSQTGNRYNSHQYNHHNNYRNKRGRNNYDIGPAIIGAIIGGVIVNGIQQQRRGLSNSHIQYCYNRYRSYRAYDNTFQPYHGHRKQCR